MMQVPVFASTHSHSRTKGVTCLMEQSCREGPGCGGGGFKVSSRILKAMGWQVVARGAVEELV